MIEALSIPTDHEAAQDRAGESSPGESNRAVGMSFCMPTDLGFAHLPERVRKEVSTTLRVMECIHRARSVNQGCRAQAAKFAGRRGFSAPSLRRKYDAYRASGGDWRVLIDRAKAGPDWQEREVRLPRDFVDYWKSLCDRNKRKWRPAHGALRRQWQLWRDGDRSQAIPGYAQAPAADPGTDLPAGWSYRNLTRPQYLPTPFETDATRVGRTRALENGPKVLTTRAGLEVGQFILFDDFWHDFKVVVPGQRVAQRLLQYHALDLFSGCLIARGYKPAMDNEITGVQERLKEVEMVHLVCHILQTHGYRPAGTQLIVEHGTATIREELEETLLRISDGKIQVGRGGRFGAAAFAGHYGGPKKGNPRFKAALESIGNLISNRTADERLFPGQTGSNSRLNMPEDLVGRDAEARLLLRAAAALPPEEVAKLALPFLGLDEAIWLAESIQEEINLRTEHNLEGWEAARLMAHEWRLDPTSDHWRPRQELLEMAPERRAAIEALVTTDAHLVQSRRMAPAEVWQAGRQRLRQLAGHQVALILREHTKDGAREVSVAEGRIEFQAQDLGGAHSFLAELVSGQGPARMLADGERYEAVLNPLSPQRLYVFDAAGRYQGHCPASTRPSRGDAEELAAENKRLARIQSDLLKPVAARGAAVTRARNERMASNIAVLQGGRLTPEAAATPKRASSRSVVRDALKNDLPEDRAMEVDLHDW